MTNSTLTKIEIKTGADRDDKFYLFELDYNKVLERDEQDRIILNIPFELKNDAKKAGAKFNSTLKKWVMTDEVFENCRLLYIKDTAYTTGKNLVHKDGNDVYADVDSTKKYFFCSDASRTYHTGIKTVEGDKLV